MLVRRGSRMQQRFAYVLLSAKASSDHPSPSAATTCLQTSIRSPVSTTPAAATPPPMPTARKMSWSTTLAQAFEAAVG